jgi:hypothetical protein
MDELCNKCGSGFIPHETHCQCPRDGKSGYVESYGRLSWVNGEPYDASEKPLDRAIRMMQEKAEFIALRAEQEFRTNKIEV